MIKKCDICDSENNRLQRKKVCFYVVVFHCGDGKSDYQKPLNGTIRVSGRHEVRIRVDVRGLGIHGTAFPLVGFAFVGIQS